MSGSYLTPVIWTMNLLLGLQPCYYVVLNSNIHFMTIKHIFSDNYDYFNALLHKPGNSGVDSNRVESFTVHLATSLSVYGKVYVLYRILC